MFFARCAVLTGCLILELATVAPRIYYPRVPAVRSAAQSTAPQPATTQPPQAYTLPPGKFEKAIALNRIRNVFAIVDSLWGVAVLWLLLASRAAAALDTWTQRLVPYAWLQGLLFFAVFWIVFTLANLPPDIYDHHVSLSYGISIQGWGSWFADHAKSLGLGLLFLEPVLLLFNHIVRRWPHRSWLRVWIPTLPIMVLSVFASPLLEPVYNKYEPLAKDHPALAAELEKVVARTGTNIPLDRMFLMKASVKTNGLNAYVSGLGATKRIVVWDTTADRIPTDETLFIFAHESGHYVLHHILKGLAISAVALLFVFWACAGFAEWLVRRFGARWHIDSISTRAGFLVLIFSVSVAGFLFAPVTNAVSRYFEHQADVYGQEATHSLVPDPQKTAVAAFNALGEAWLEDPNPSPFIEFWEYDHPSVKTRANFAAHYDPWANGGHGEFFDK
jgi:STE24 endopeptidase